MGKLKPNKPIVWVPDECLTQDKKLWKANKNDKIATLKGLKLLGEKDISVNEKLAKKFPNGRIIITSDKGHNKRGDNFFPSESSGIIKFASDINTTKLEVSYYKKFRKMIKENKKLLGAESTISKFNVIYKRGKKLKTLKYKNYI